MIELVEDADGDFTARDELFDQDAVTERKCCAQWVGHGIPPFYQCHAESGALSQRLDHDPGMWCPEDVGDLRFRVGHGGVPSDQ